MSKYSILGRCGKVLLTLATLVFSGPAVVSAADLSWNLANHPDGNAAPPLYGFRLDNILVGGTAQTLTFDLDGEGGLVMEYTKDANGLDSNGVRISGTVRGGIDAGNSWSESALWTFEVNYSETNASQIQIFESPANSDKWELFILGTAQMTGTVEITNCDLCSGLALGDEVQIGMGGTKDYNNNTNEANDFSGLLGADAANVNFFYELIADGDYDHRLTAPTDSHCPDLTEPACQRTNVGAGWVNVTGVGGGLGLNHATGARDWLLTGVITSSEPGVLGLMFFGLAGIGFVRARKKALQA